MNNRIVLIFALALIASGCASTSNPDQTDQPGQTSEQASNTSNNTVTLTNSGFQPSTITIQQGETVTWINNGSTAMWVGSDRHPRHTEYSGSSVAQHCQGGDQNSAAFDQCSAGEEFSFKFEKTGEWSYHNHRAPSQTGIVVVE